MTNIAPGFIRRNRLLIVWLLMLAILGAAPPAIPPLEAAPGPAGSTGWLRPGMKGYGRTVFKGTRIETFPVTVVGIARKRLGDADMILIHVDGGYPVSSGAGIIGGMSGSPIYVEGRLIGALAYGWTFSKDPLAGVTPIDRMLDYLPSRHRNDPAPPLASRVWGDAATAGRSSGGSAARYQLEQPLVWKGRNYRAIQVLPWAGAPADRIPSDTMVLSPVPTLLQVSGFNPRGMDTLARLLRPYNLVPVQGMGLAPSHVKSPPLVPGSSVGIRLVEGDMQISTSGTLTYAKGNEILAFGHSFSELGSIRLPMVTSYVNAVIVSVLSSAKITSPIATVGEVSNDGYFCIAGKAGAPPPVIPVSIQVWDRANNLKRNCRIRVARHPLLSPLLIESIAEQAVSQWTSVVGDRTARISYVIKAQGFPELRFQDQVYSRELPGEIASQVAGYLEGVIDNPFLPLELKEFRLQIQIVPQRATALIQKVSLPDAQVLPNEPLRLAVGLLPFQGQAETREIEIDLPSGLSSGTLKIGVSGGENVDLVRKKLLIPSPRITSPAQLIRFIEGKERNQQLVIQVVLPDKGATVAGERFAFVPASLRAILSDSAQSDIRIEKDVIELRYDTPWVIQGSQLLGVKVSEEVGMDLKARRASLLDLISGDEGLSGSSVGPGEIRAGDGDSGTAVRPGADPGPGLTGSEPTMVPRADDEGKDNGDGDKEEKDESAASTASTAAAGDGAVLPAGTRAWKLNNLQAFRRGTFENTGYTAVGEICLAPIIRELVDAKDAFIWSLWRDPATKTIYAGTGIRGQVLCDKQDGTPPLWVETGEVAVTALAPGPEGGVYAATAPRGRLYLLDRTGKARLVFTAPEHYLWSLAADGQGGVFVGSGRPGTIYHVTPGGAFTTLARTATDHITALAPAPEGGLFAGTGSQGDLLLVGIDGAVKVLLSTGADSIDALAVNSAGTLFAGAGNKLYRRSPDGSIKVFVLPDQYIRAVCPGADGSCYIGTIRDGRLYLLGEDENLRVVSDLREGLFLALAPGGEGDCYAGTGSPARVLHLDGRIAAQGTFTSDVFDAGATATWGRVQIDTRGAGKDAISIQVRAGDSPQPDDHWSPWVGATTGPAGLPPGLPPARFLQIRAQLSGSGDPLLAAAGIFYRFPPRAPELTILSPNVGAAWSGKNEIRWKSSGTDPDQLIFDLEYSLDSGATWQPILKGLVPTAASGKGRDPYTRNLEHEWNTRPVADGPCLVRITSRGRLDPNDPGLKREVVSSPFTICNTAPEVYLLSYQYGENLLTIRGVARSALVNLTAVSLKADDGSWVGALPSDGMFDSSREEFTAVASLPGPGKYTLQVKVKDQAGNSTTLKKKIRIVESDQGSTVEDLGGSAETLKASGLIIAKICIPGRAENPQ